MTSFIIVSQDQEKVDKQIATILKRFAIDPFNVTTLRKKSEDKEKTTKKGESKSTKSIGIDDIKEIQKKIFLKPLRGNMKAIIIEQGEKLTIEAQNALLKVLEEPPAHTIIMITAKSKEVFLPTILSRSYLIALEAKHEMTEVEEKWTVSFLKTFDAMTVPKALETAEELAKNKETGLAGLENAIRMLHVELVKNSDELLIIRQAYLLSILQKLHREIATTNVNARLSIEAALLSFCT